MVVVVVEMVMVVVVVVMVMVMEVMVVVCRRGKAPGRKYEKKKEDRMPSTSQG
jgi:hypothetical protein